MASVEGLWTYTTVLGVITSSYAYTHTHYRCCSLSNTQQHTLDLLVSETGSFDGSKAVGIEESGGHILDISADGNWTVSTMHPMLLSEALRARGNKADCASTGYADCASRQASQHQSSVV